MDSGYGPALRRFWWVLALGGIFAALVAFLMVYSVGAGGITHREKPVYTAAAKLFVTSGDAPYLRTSVPREVPIGTDDVQTGTRAVVQINDAPDVKTLVDAANVYPLLIESDDVANLRTQLYGDPSRRGHGSGDLRVGDRQPLPALGDPDHRALRDLGHAEGSHRARRRDVEDVPAVDGARAVAAQRSRRSSESRSRTSRLRPRPPHRAVRASAFRSSRCSRFSRLSERARSCSTGCIRGARRTREPRRARIGSWLTTSRTRWTGTSESPRPARTSRQDGSRLREWHRRPTPQTRDP